MDIAGTLITEAEISCGVHLSALSLRLCFLM